MAVMSNHLLPGLLQQGLGCSKLFPDTRLCVLAAFIYRLKDELTMTPLVVGTTSLNVSIL